MKEVKQVASVRITATHKKIVESIYGSMQKFMDEKVVELDMIRSSKIKILKKMQKEIDKHKGKK